MKEGVCTKMKGNLPLIWYDHIRNWTRQKLVYFLFIFFNKFLVNQVLKQHLIRYAKLNWLCKKFSRLQKSNMMHNSEFEILKFVFSKKATKNRQNLHRRFDNYYIMSNWWQRFRQFLWPSENTWTLMFSSVMSCPKGSRINQVPSLSLCLDGGPLPWRKLR